MAAKEMMTSTAAAAAAEGRAGRATMADTQTDRRARGADAADASAGIVVGAVAIAHDAPPQDAVSPPSFDSDTPADRSTDRQARALRTPHT